MIKFITPFRLRNLAMISIAIWANLPSHAQTTKDDKSDLKKGLIGYWKLSGDITTQSGDILDTKMHGQIQLDANGPNGKGSSAGFDGRSTWLEVLPNPKAELGKGDFTLSTWIYTEDALNDVPGDIVSQYDPSTRKGFHLSLKTNAVTTSYANSRQLSFSIDDNVSSKWEDYGRPGNALVAMGMAEYKGELYAATTDTAASGRGHVYRLSAGNKWVDCGFLDSSNSAMALAVFNGELYAGTGYHRTGGSALPDSENKIPGGKVFRYVAPNKWVDCGQLPGVITIGGMIVYNGKLYVSSMYKPAALYRYEGDKKWIQCSIPDGKRVVNLAVYDGHMYATSWDLGRVYRFDGNSWTDCGQVGEESVNTQTYCFAVYHGKLYVATWRSGRVYRFDGVNQWTDVGRLGTELEVMGMLVHNGRLIAGTLPLGEVYSYEGDTTWVRMDQIDRTPDVKYRRAWTMAEHDGKAFCSTLPSGKIYGYEAGKSVMSPFEVASGWQHVAAIKTKDRLKLFVNGKLVKETEIPASAQYNLNSQLPLKIGFGPNDYFQGRMRELRIYNRALNNREVSALAK